MNIAIVNAWSDDNKGDAAIVEGMVRSLTARSGEQWHFDVLSMFRRPVGESDHYRHTLRLSADMSIHPALLAVDAPRGGSRLLRVLEFARAALVLLLGRHARRLFPSARATLSALSDADLVISKGGHICFSHGSLKTVLGLFRNLFPLMLAQRLGRPTIVYGQSIGPVQGRLQRFLARRILARLDGLYVREPISLATLDELDVPGGRLCWDTAFAIEAEPLPEDLAARLRQPFVALTVRQWGFPYSDADPAEQYREYLAAVAHCVRRFAEECRVPVVVAPQAIGPTPMENDLTAMNDLRASMREVGGAAAGPTFVEEDLTAGQLLTLYGQAELILATRFHSAILAIAAGTPPVAISYHGPKAVGIMQMLNLEEHTVSIGEVTPSRLWSICSDAWRNRDSTAEKIRRRIPEIRRSIASASSEILDLAR